MAGELKDPWERVCEELRERILAGELRPGERILEVPLAKQFELSRGPIREALRMLVAEGLVVRQPRLGAIVVPIDERTADEVFSMRVALEPFAAKRAFERYEGDLSLRLLLPLENMRTALDNDEPNAVLDWDLEFHFALIEAADHQRLAATWNGLVGPLRILLGLSAQRGTEEHRRSLRGHEQIYEAVKRRDLEATAAALTEHLETARLLVVDEVPPRAFK